MCAVLQSLIWSARGVRGANAEKLQHTRVFVTRLNSEVAQSLSRDGAALVGVYLLEHAPGGFEFHSADGCIEACYNRLILAKPGGMTAQFQREAPMCCIMWFLPTNALRLAGDDGLPEKRRIGLALRALEEEIQHSIFHGTVPETSDQSQHTITVEGEQPCREVHVHFSVGEGCSAQDLELTASEDEVELEWESSDGLQQRSTLVLPFACGGVTRAVFDKGSNVLKISLPELH